MNYRRCIRQLWLAALAVPDLANGDPAAAGTGHEQRGRRYGVIVQADELQPRPGEALGPKWGEP
jgi:hypothetical protein